MSKRKPALRIGGSFLNRNTLNNSPERIPAKDYRKDAVVSSTGTSTLSKSTGRIDEEIANFLKEIDDVSTTSPSLTASAQNQPVKYGDWQQCIDDKTQHPYYWNTVTDEVTWVLPEEVLAASQKQPERTSTPVEVAAEVKEEYNKLSEVELKKPALKLVEDYDESDIKEDDDDAEDEDFHSDQRLDESEKIPDDDIDIDEELENAFENKKEDKPNEDNSSEEHRSADMQGNSFQQTYKEGNVKESHSSQEHDTRSNGGDSLSPNSANLSSQIQTLSNTLLSKMKFLGISKASLINLHILLIEIETRLSDWKENALSTTYVLKKLEEADLQLHNYEESATPAGWSCHWDSSAERYFYMNEKTRKKQWQYPEIHNVGETTSVEAPNNDGEPVSSKKEQKNISPPKDPVAPLPPLPDAPEEKPPPPPDDGFDVGDEDEDDSDDDGIKMEISDGEKEEGNDRHITTTAVKYQEPVLYQDLSTRLKSSSPHTIQHPVVAQQSLGGAVGKIRASSEPKVISSKIKKKKTKGTKKPSKGISTLVAKWQKAKNEIEEEDRMLEQNDDDELDQGELTQMQIEKWKQDQLTSGKSLSNANFEPVPEDWRTRLLSKKKKKT